MPGVRMTQEQFDAIVNRVKKAAMAPSLRSKSSGNTHSRAKYGNRKTSVLGVEFDSKREAKRYQELKALQLVGLITDLELQVRYELIPKQKTPSGKTERACEYVADFRYRDKFGHLVVEDVKGMKTRDYVIKRKLMMQIHKIELQEI